jgi:hypothetical protein
MLTIIATKRIVYIITMLGKKKSNKKREENITYTGDYITVRRITAPAHGEFEPTKVNLAYQSLPQSGARSPPPSHTPKQPNIILELDEFFLACILLIKTKISVSFKVYLLRLTQPLVH